MLVTHRRPDGRHERYTADAPPAGVAFDTTRADVSIGESSVRQVDGQYRLVVSARGTGGAVTTRSCRATDSNRYFPPVELRDDDFLSGYVVPALSRIGQWPGLRRRALFRGAGRAGVP